jgi:predicted regulator of Ras-like GTPase activity (Roadblock/LC7/MglB family)
MVIWKVYKLQQHIIKQNEKEQLENEVIEGLLELKKSSTPKKQEMYNASNEYELIELALENNLSDITIACEEGLPIISTIKNPDEIAAKYSALFEYARNNNGGINNLQKISIKSEDGYKYIISIVKNGIPLYCIISSNIELDPINEKILIKGILNILDRYISENNNVEEEYEKTIHIVK